MLALPLFHVHGLCVGLHGTLLAGAWTLAADLAKVPLADALSLLLLALEQEPWRFDAAAPRWQRRLCAEARLRWREA